MQCHHCGQNLDLDATVCAHCGAITKPTTEQTLITGSELGDTLIGFVIGTALMLMLFIGLIANPILFFVLRAKRRSFALGVLFGMILPVLAVLGIFVVCFVQPVLLTKIYR